MDVTLSAVREAEYDDFFAMLEPYYRELDAYDPMGPDPYDIETHRRAMLDDMEGRELLWMIADGDRAGLAIVRTQPDWPDESRSVASIVELYVVPDRRGRGIGRAAVESVLAEHRRRGTALVEASVLRGNEPAKAFWAALGFEVQSILTARTP